MPTIRHLLLLVLAFPLACQDTDTPQSLYYDGDHLEVWASDGLEADVSSLVADFEQQRACRLEAWRFHDVECSVLPLEPWQDADRWSVTVDLSCDAPDVIGPRFDTVWARRGHDLLVQRDLRSRG